MFLYTSPKVWNLLPLSSREIETLYLFKKRLKAYYLNLTFEDITIVLIQERSQKFAMGGLFWGSGGGAPALENFAFFCKNNLILGIFDIK